MKREEQIKTNNIGTGKGRSVNEKTKTDEAEERATGKGSMQSSVAAELKNRRSK